MGLAISMMLVFQAAATTLVTASTFPSWKTNVPVSGSFLPRSKFGGASVNSAGHTAYMFGGAVEEGYFHRISELFNDLVSMTIEPDGSHVTFTTLPNLGDVTPTARYRHCFAASDHYALVVGGVANTWITGEQVSMLYDFRTNEWSSVSSGGPSRLIDAVALQLNGNFYVFGGAENVRFPLSTLWRFDPIGLQWTEVTDATGATPIERVWAKGAVSGNKLYFYGGAPRLFNFNMKSMDVYDVETNSWGATITFDAHDQLWSSFSAVQNGDSLMLFSGSLPDGDCGQMGLNGTSDSWIFDVKHQTWSSLAVGGSSPIPDPSMHGEGVYLDPYFVAVGGFNCDVGNSDYHPENSDYHIYTTTVSAFSIPQISASPSSLPSGEPSFMPSETPSRMSSTFPSKEPSKTPSLVPSNRPSLTQSSSPSNPPSTNPSLSPTYPPSQAPSVSKEPSAPPSQVPSRSSEPSASPTIAPSSNPSFSPSTVPTTRPPTDTPSSQPSTVPSEALTKRPSLRPSHRPSGATSGAPSRMPTKTPSLAPSNQPSGAPTNAPSSNPSSLPSATPSTPPPSMSPTTSFSLVSPRQADTFNAPDVTFEWTLVWNPAEINRVVYRIEYKNTTTRIWERLYRENVPVRADGYYIETQNLVQGLGGPSSFAAYKWRILVDAKPRTGFQSIKTEWVVFYLVV